MVFIRLVFLCFLALIAVSSLADDLFQEGMPTIPKKSEGESLASLPHFEDLARELSASVVNVAADSKQPKEEATEPIVPGLPFYKGNPESPLHSLGSGFIVTKDGYIVTNNHVVEDADKIIVRLLDDKSEYVAKLIGKDEKTDLALIKIEPHRDLQPVHVGDSDALKVGEWVLAIGNQFQLGQTVTAGIVSAKSRKMPTKSSGPYDSFIQTDASINPGSSGGPLFNTKGQVIGINTAIFSPGRSQFGGTGFNIGIGFSIPINLAKGVLQQLRENGTVTRGLLGVIIQHIDNDTASALGLSSADGALVADVVKGSPAAKAGFKVRDVITSYEGQPIKEHDELPLLVANTKIGSTVSIGVLRSGKNLTLKADIVQLTADKEVLEKEKGEERLKPNELGMIVDDVDGELAKMLKLDSVSGVVVQEVTPNSIAQKSGILKGDVIVEFGEDKVGKMEDLDQAIKKLSPGKATLVLVKRKEGTRFVTVKKE